MAVTLNSTGITFSNGTSISAPTTLGGIGSVALLHYAASTGTPPTSTSHYGKVLASGTTIAGSSLRRSNLASGDYTQLSRDQRLLTGQQAWTNPSVMFTPLFQNVSNSASYQYTVNSVAMSGTWRLVGGNTWALFSNVSGATYAGWCPLLFVRIS